MFMAIKERRFAKRLVRRLLNSDSTVSAAKPDLSGKALYREILLHTEQLDATSVDGILRQAEDSVDEWTSPNRNGLGFREVAHFFVVSRYLEAGRTGTVASFRDIVNALIPENI